MQQGSLPNEHQIQHRGLPSREALRLLSETGPNEPAPQRSTAGFIQLLLLFANPLIVILLIASLVSAVVGDLVNASIIVMMVLLGVAFNFIQTARSQRAVARLRKEVAPTAAVLRDDKWIEIPRRELVPGDVIRLAAGDMVPADARLLESRDLHVQQAALTGESLPVEKDVADIPFSAEDIAGARNMVFLGTSVVSGTATALVTVTGPKTAWVQ